MEQTVQETVARAFRLDGQTALVTGASRGIGAAVADWLAAAGAYVIGTATSEAGAEAIRARFAAAGLSGEGHVLDVTDGAAAERLVRAIEKARGAITILVNNAGITKDNLAMRMKDDEWQAVIDTNLTAVFRLSRLVLKGMMKARYGRIINITSVVGSMGNAGQANYAAAKAGVAGMSRALARELGSRNITVNCVAPGFIETNMTEALPEAQRELLASQIALGRLGSVAEVAGCVLFLASPAASYVTGATLHVNGGMYMA
ncbi:3-oxoacyl-ACP reductase FabG [Hydrogenophilus thiooxidans]|uniref:3-oxoacyl-ACP reductase FabG n=1 Tax=Hydrogenophilus thiooxidans TaxID=2820326 RepID=UPI001C24A847|nr:3-oxoacyl-ACP reductase FabG [Hydrogenophilus thiooxidans]